MKKWNGEKIKRKGKSSVVEPEPPILAPGAGARAGVTQKIGGSGSGSSSDIGNMNIKNFSKKSKQNLII